MNTSGDKFDDSVESLLACVQPRVNANAVRDATLRSVQRELRASRWDRRLGRLAAVLLVAGIGVNIGTVNQPPAGWPLADASTSESLAEFGVTIPDITGIKLAHGSARYWTTLSGLTTDICPADVIGQENDDNLTSTIRDGKDG